MERRTVRRDGGFIGQAVSISGLSATSTDVLVRIESLAGTVQTERLSPTKTAFIIQAVPGAWEIAATYLHLGVEHILFSGDATALGFESEMRLAAELLEVDRRPGLAVPGNHD